MQERTPTAYDLAVIHDAQAHLLSLRTGATVPQDREDIEDRGGPLSSPLDEVIAKFADELGIPSEDEIEVWLAFTPTLDMGPVRAIQSFLMLVMGYHQDHTKKAKGEGWIPDEDRLHEYKEELTVENLNAHRDKVQEEKVEVALKGLAGKLGLPPEAAEAAIASARAKLGEE